MDSYNTEAIFHLPGLFMFHKGYYTLLELTQSRPEVFKDNIKIGSIYGSPQCIWNGGRFISGIWSENDLIGMKTTLTCYQIPARFTFTNCLLTKEHVYDTYGNLILKIFNTGTNEIICNTDVLENYIREKYGDNYKYISSTTKCLFDKNNQEQELLKDYYLTVLNFDHNKDIEYIKTLPNKDKIEILCNPVCRKDCPMKKFHYRNISQSQLNFDISQLYHCKETEACLGFWEVKRKSPLFISDEDINNTYLPLGIKNFKLEGRTNHPLDWVEIILYYLIKENYKDEIRLKLQQSLW